MQRRRKAEQFLAGDGNVRGRKGAEGDVMLDQAFDCIAKAVHRRLVTCVKQQDKSADELGRAEARAILLCRDQLCDKIIGGGRAALHDIGGQEI